MSQSDRTRRKAGIREDLLGNSLADLRTWASELRTALAGETLTLPQRSDYRLELEVIEKRTAELEASDGK